MSSSRTRFVAVAFLSAACAIAIACNHTIDPPAFVADEAMASTRPVPFRERGGAIVAEYRAYEANVARSGALSFTPRGATKPLLVTTTIDGETPASVHVVDDARRSTAAEADLRFSGALKLVDDATVSIAHGAVVEHLRSTVAGVEQSWLFASAPSGEVDVRVHVQVSGYVYDGEIGAVHRFVDASSQRAVHYGPATWIDARGQRTPVVVEREPTGLAITVPHALIARSSFPATLDPVISPELAVDTTGTADQIVQAAAWNGSSYLVAWIDKRSGSEELWAGRLSSTGAVMGSSRKIASNVAGASAASDGSGFLLSWVDLIPDGSGSITSTLHAARISPTTGEVLDTPPLTISTTVPDSTAAMTFDGQSYVLAWSDMLYFQFSGRNIFAARVSPAGMLLDPNAIVVNAALADQTTPSVASNGETTLIVWSDGKPNNDVPDIRAARLAHNGTVLNPTSLLVVSAGFDQTNPSVTWDGARYIVAFGDGRRTANNDKDVYFARVSADGKVLDPGGVLVAQTVTELLAPAAISVGDGASTLVAWNTPDGMRGAFVRGSTGEVLDKNNILLIDTNPATFAPNAPGKVAVFYNGMQNGVSRALARLIDAGGAQGTTCQMSTDCRTRYCRDTFCCEEPCDGPCRRCGSDGKCTIVKLEDDDACAGSCDTAGACKKKNGAVCGTGAECASGFCADGFCCDKACDGACDVCNDTPGKCTILATGTRGNPNCSPKVCNGYEATCPARCTTDEDCAEGFGCDRPSGECVSGAVCSDARTLRGPTGVTSDCFPYTCRAGACAMTCTQVNDCAYPAVCDQLGHCIEMMGQGDGGGCSTAPLRRPSRATEALALAIAGLVGVRRSRRRQAS